MKKVIIPLIIGGVCIVVGAIFLLIFAIQNDWQIDKDIIYTEDTYTDSSDSIRTLKVEADVSKITVSRSTTESWSVHYRIASNQTCAISTQGTTLFVEQDSNHVYFFSLHSYFEISMPNSFTGNLILETDTGSITVTAGTLSDVKLKSDTGAIKVSDGTTQGVTCTTATGAIQIQNMTADNVVAEADTGAINLEDLTARSVKANTDTGAITGNDLTVSEQIVCTAEVGAIHLTQAESPAFTLKTDTGAIACEIKGVKSEYTIRVKRTLGSCNVSDQTGSTARYLEAETDIGKIDVSFTR